MLIPPRKHSINPPPKIITLVNLSLLGVKMSIVDRYSSTRTLAPSSNNIGTEKTKLIKNNFR